MGIVSLHTRAEEIRSNLSHILSSKEFSSKEKNCTLLKFLVEETLAGRADQLKQYTIGTSILNRTPDFNPDLDPIVRILAGRLRRSLKSYYEQEGRDDTIRIDIPKGSYIPIIFDMDSYDLQDNESKNISPATADIVRPAIVVQPLKNLTGDSKQDYLIQGFTQELVIELTRYEDFQVIISDDYPSETNRNKQHDITRRENARFSIGGSVRKAETTIKISIQLLDSVKGEYIWGEQYRRNLTADNLWAIQEQIVHEILTNIAGEFGIIPRKLYDDARKKLQPDLQTYDAIFRFYHYHTEFTSETYLAAFNALEQAVARDPDCGIASAMLADLYILAFAHDLPGGEKGLERAAELIRSAINAEPTNQLVRIISAVLYFHLDQQTEFLHEIKKAEALNPNSPLRLGGVGYFIALSGEWERGKQILDKAMKMNDNYPAWYHSVTTLYHYRQNEYEQAYMEAAKYDIPNMFWAPLLNGACLGQLQRHREAEEQITHLLKLKPDFRQNAHILIQRYIKEDSLVDQIMEGLQKAGL